MKKNKSIHSDSNNDQAIVSEPFRSTRKVHPKVAFVGLTVLVVAAAAGVFVVLRSQKIEAPKIPATTDSKLTEAQQQIRNGNTADAISALEAARAGATTPEEKVGIELGLAQAALDQEKFDDAISRARDANKIKETSGAYGLIGYAAGRKNDWKLAADSYAKAAELSSRDAAPNGQSEYDSYKILEQEARNR